MADKLLDLGIDKLIEEVGEFVQELQSKINIVAEQLTLQSEAHMRELASEKLHTRLKTFNKNLSSPEQISEGVWAITLGEEATWIDDGMPPHNMIEKMLASPKAKMGENGRYLVVPFKHDKGPSKQGPQQAVMLATIKQALKERKIPYKKLEKNPDGSPKLGLLHKLSFTSPAQQHTLPKGTQGPSGRDFRAHPLGTGEHGPTGRPYLWDVRIYQNKNKSGKVDRGIFTFRTVTARSAGWNHPGVAPANIFNETYEWAKMEWETKILPELLANLVGKK